MEGEERGIHLVRIQIDLGIDERTGQFLDAVGGASFGQFVGDVLRVVGG